MRFAFLVHPLSERSRMLLRWDSSGGLRRLWGGDPLEFCSFLYRQVSRSDGSPAELRVEVIDEMRELRSATARRPKAGSTKSRSSPRASWPIPSRR